MAMRLHTVSMLAFKPERTGWAGSAMPSTFTPNLEESVFRRYIADIIDGTLSPNEETPKTVASGTENGTKETGATPAHP